MSFGVDNHKIRVGILILDCPEFGCHRIDFQTIVVAGHRVRVDDATIHFVFHDLAVQPVGTVRQVAVTVTNEDMIAKDSDGIRCAQSCGSFGKHSQFVGSHGSLRERGISNHAEYHQKGRV